MAESVRFWWRGRLVEVAGPAVGTSVLEWLRLEAGATGTKEGCNEGDCGACTVVLGDRADTQDGSPGTLALSTADACLLLLPMLHGRALFTVEDVADGDRLHPVQQALVDHHGSQCGFCTPGLVMSLWCALERSRGGAAPGREDLARALSGNLCRCTGYRPVLDAAEAAGQAVAADQRTGALDASTVLDALAQVPADEVLDYRSGTDRFVAPTTVDGLVEALSTIPGSVVLAGGTDLVLAARLAGTDLPALVWTGRVAELAAVHRTGSRLVIGAGATLERAWEALAEAVPDLTAWWYRFAGPAVRSVGTLGGNVANGSPIADGTPVLLALDAEAVLVGPSGQRRVALEDFHVGRRATVLGPGEVLARLEVPLESTRRRLRAYKVSRRYDSDISTVSGVFALDVDHGTVVQTRIVFGGMAATVRRAHTAEAALVGRPWDESALAAAQDALSADLAPMSDHRGSADHRARTARALLRRWWLETRPDDPMTVAQTQVWSAP